LRFNEVRISLLALKLLLIALLCDIGGGFGLKYAAMGIVFIVSAYKVASHGVDRRWWPEAVIVLFLLTAGLLSVAAGTPTGRVYGELSFLAFFSLVALLYRVEPDQMWRAFLGAAILGASVIIVAFLLLLLAPAVGKPLADLGMANGLGYLGYRPGFDGLPNVYFRWSVWLVLGLALALVSRSFWAAVVVGAAGILTTSTAIMLMLVLVVVGYITVVERRARGWLLSVAAGGLGVGVAAVGLFMFGGEVADFVTSKFSAESPSTLTKLGHIQSVFDELRANWWVAIFGQGVGTSFFSVGVGHEVTNIEVSHFNVLRQYGVIGAAMVMAYIAFVIAKVARCGKVGKAWALGLVGMFFVAGTNPLLLSPMFFVPLLMARMFVLGHRKGVGYGGR
jgi:hypothetical protein